MIEVMRMKNLAFLAYLLLAVFCSPVTAAAQAGQSASGRVDKVPQEDARLKAEFLEELTSYKKDFRLPVWAQPGRARQIRFDGGPMFAACQFESGWKYLTDPATPGFVGMIKSVWTLTNLYTDDIGRRLDEIRGAGYNWVWVSYQLGYAFEDEARQRAQVRKLIQLAHARGIKVTAYFSLTSIFSNSAYIGNPESKTWTQEQIDGAPLTYAGIPVRLMACVNKPGRLDYLKKIVRLAVEDGADDIFWDSIFNRCYCAHCEEGFRKYSERVLGKAHAIPRRAAAGNKAYGIEENFDFLGLTTNSVEGLFAEYGHYAAAKAIAELDRYAKSINPEVLVSANSHRFRYVDQVTDITWCEDSNGRGGRIDEKGQLVTPIGIYAWAQAVAGGREPAQLTVAPHEYWQIQKPEYYKLTIAESASFQATFVMLGGYAFSVRFDDGDVTAKRAWDGVGTGLGFIERHQGFYENARPVADVGLYYSHTTRVLPAPGSKETSDQWQIVAQALYLAGIPLRIITEESALREGASAMLAKAKMMILLGVSSLSDEEIALFREYVGLGGKLAVTPDSGLYTSFWTRRQAAPWGKESAGVKLVSGADLTSSEKVTELAGQLTRRPPLVKIEGRGYQLVNPTLQGERLVLHVLNYETSNPLKNVRVTIAPTGYAKEIASALNRNSVVRWLTPDYDGDFRLPITWTGDQASVVVPELRVSGLLVVSAK
jgi:hypothetical protein